jgi:hypothetical protein
MCYLYKIIGCPLRNYYCSWAELIKYFLVTLSVVLTVLKLHDVRSAVKRCAILWKSDTSARVETMSIDSRRVCAIKMYIDKWGILFINVYMPYEDGDERYELLLCAASVYN